jgi:hypothetical protein
MWMRTGPPKKELGPLSDHWTGWPLIVWLFPVRNIANWFEENADEWFFHLRGLIVAGVAAVLWAAVLYYLFQLVRSRRIAT